MANTNWFMGIDEGLSTPGGTQVPLANHLFVDASFVGVSDGSPDAPYKTIQDAITAGGNGTTIIVAAGRYEDEVTATNYSDISVVANVNGTVSLINTNKTTVTQLVGSSSTQISVEGCYLEDFDISFIQKELIDCVIDNSQNSGGFNFVQFIAESAPCRFERCKFLNGTGIRVQGFGSFENDDTCEIERCTFVGAGSIFENPSLTGANVYAYDLQNNDFQDAGFTIVLSDKCDTGGSNFNNCNFRGTQSNTDTPSNLIPETDNIDIDPDYAGSPNDFEFIIEKNSPLIGAGTNNSTIGAFRVGELIDFSGAILNDITVGPPFVITDPARKGDATPTFKTFDRVRESPIVTFNGFLDGENDLPNANEQGITPLRWTLNITFREDLTGTTDISGLFLYGLPMFKDNSGRYTGEDNFDVFDISSTGDILNNPDLLDSSNLVNVGQIQPVINLVDKYDHGNAVKYADQANERGASTNISPSNVAVTDEFSTVNWFTIDSVDDADWPNNVGQPSLRQLIFLVDTIGTSEYFTIEIQPNATGVFNWILKYVSGGSTVDSASINASRVGGRHLVCSSVNIATGDITLWVKNSEQSLKLTANLAIGGVSKDINFCRVIGWSGGQSFLACCSDAIVQNNKILTDNEVDIIWSNGKGSYEQDTIIDSVNTLLRWDHNTIVEPSKTVTEDEGSGMDMQLTNFPANGYVFDFDDC